MLPRKTATESTTAAVVAPRTTNKYSGKHATTRSSVLVLFAACTSVLVLFTACGSQLVPAPPSEVESARTTQFVATVVTAIQDAYTCGGSKSSAHRE